MCTLEDCSECYSNESINEEMTKKYLNLVDID